MNKAEQQALGEVLETYHAFRDSHQDALRSSEENFDFVLGKQWNDADISKLEDAGLPYLTKNLILPIINRIYGMELQNRTDLVVAPTEDGLDETAWAMTRLNYYFKRIGKLPQKLSKLFVLGLISDMGAYIRPAYTTLTDPLGTIEFNVINGMNVLTDPMGKEYDLSDHKRILYTTWWTKKDALNAFPQKKKDIEALQDFKPNLFDRVVKRVGKTTDLIDTRERTSRGGRYRLVEMWEKKEKLDRFWFDPMTGEKHRPKTMREREELLFYRPQVFDRTIKKTEMHVKITLGDAVLLFDGLAPVQSPNYPFIPFHPYYFNGDTLGVVNNLKDYNREHNKRSSSILHILMATANSGWLAPKGSIDKDRWAEDSSRNGAILEYNGQRPEKIQPNQIPSGMVYTDEQAKQGIYETSGVGPNLLGRAENSRESGKLFERRVDEGNIMLQPLFENYAYTKELLGEYLIWIYQNKFTQERVFTVINEENRPERMVINQQTASGIVNDMKIGQYNVTTDTVTKAISERQSAQDQVANIVRFMPPELVDWGQILRLTDLPPEIKEKMAQYAEAKLGIANALNNAGQSAQADPASIESLLGA